MMNPKNMPATIRMFIAFGASSKDIIDQWIDNIDLQAEGPEFLAVSVQASF